jgi:hypothetical protein
VKTIRLADGRIFHVHTNKQEGLHSHLKHKMKKIFGTCTDHVDGYIAEAILRLNASAEGKTVFMFFMEQIHV